MSAHKNFSTYIGFVIWGAAGFTAQPTIASAVVHLAVLPVMIIAAIWVARNEGTLK